MPQAPPELRAKFPGSDAEAEKVLRPNFTIHFPSVGIISKRDSAYKPNAREWDAVDYLIQEWDYDYIEK